MWPERPLHQPLRWRRHGGLGAKQSAEQRNPARRSNEKCPDEPVDCLGALETKSGDICEARSLRKFHGVMGYNLLTCTKSRHRPGRVSLALCALVYSIDRSISGKQSGSQELSSGLGLVAKLLDQIHHHIFCVSSSCHQEACHSGGTGCQTEKDLDRVLTELWLHE